MLLPSIFTSKGLMNDNLFDDWMDFNDPFRSGVSLLKEMGGGITYDMKTDIKETDNGYELTMNLAGVDKNDIEASVDNGYLNIKVSHAENKEDKNEKYLRRERYVGAMSRSFYVGDSITEQDIKAKFENGVLTLDIPKLQKEEKEEPKKLVTIQ